MTIKKYLLNTCACALSVGLLGSATLAGDKETLSGWATQAGAEVNEVMTYPRFAIRQGASGTAKFKVTINRSGEVLDAVMIERPNYPALRSAARRVVDSVDLPALPYQYGKDKLTFALNLKYQIVATPYEVTKLRRQGQVAGEQIAQASGPLVASITLLED